MLSSKEKEMKITKILGVVAVAALALMAFASAASATTLEKNGVKVTTNSTIHATNEGSILLSATGGGLANTCTESTVEGTTTNATGTTVGGPISVLSFKKCTKEEVVVDAAGSLTIENIKIKTENNEEHPTTNGTVRSIGAKVTVPSFFGALTCVTAASPGTDIGTFTGTASGNGTMDINAVLNCGFFLPSAKWEGTYAVTSGPNGVTA
jgi:hypothetical protein